MDEKQAVRAKLRALRREHAQSLPASMRGLVFLRPPSPIAALAPEGSVVGLYHAIGNEAPARGYAKWFLENGRRIALPWFASRGETMTFREWRDPWDDGDLEPGPYRMLQPAGDAPELEPSVLIVPLLGFTADGTRLGHGAGHYDRWLAAHPSATPIGLAWDCQLVDTLPLEPHDRPLHAVVTPTRIIERSL